MDASDPGVLKGVGPELCDELLRTPSLRTSRNTPSETVWKIAPGFSSVRFCRREPADRLLYGCFWRPSAT